MVKKLPVLFIGKISVINKNMKGIIILLFFKDDCDEKYFLNNVINNIFNIIQENIKNQPNQVQ